MLATKDIFMQPYSNACAHAAIINLCKLRGLETPSFDQIETGLQVLMSVSGSRIGDQDAPKAIDILNFLVTSGFICALVGIPPALWAEPQKILTQFLDQGCHLLLFFNWRNTNGSVVTHVTLVEGYDERGYQVIDGEPGYYPEGAPFELEPQELSAEEEEKVRKWLENHSHGSRRTLPFYGIGLNTTENLALGLTQHALVVYE